MAAGARKAAKKTEDGDRPATNTKRRPHGDSVSSVRNSASSSRQRRQSEKSDGTGRRSLRDIIVDDEVSPYIGRASSGSIWTDGSKPDSVNEMAVLPMPFRENLQVKRGEHRRCYALTLSSSYSSLSVLSLS